MQRLGGGSGAGFELVSGGRPGQCERTLGFRRVALDRLAELLKALMQRFGGGPGAGFDLVGGGFRAAGPKVFETADPALQRVGDLERARAQGPVNLAHLGADRVGDFGAARIDSDSPRADAAVERLDPFLAALDHKGSQIGDTSGQRRLELRGAGVNRADQFAGAAGDTLVESVDVIAHCLRDLMRALAKALDQFGAVSLPSVVKFGEMARDQAADRSGVTRDLFSERGTALAEPVLECL